MLEVRKRLRNTKEAKRLHNKPVKFSVVSSVGHLEVQIIEKNAASKIPTS